MSDERTERPSSKRLRDARAEAHVPRSSDIGSAAALLGAMLLTSMVAEEGFEAMRALTREALTQAVLDPKPIVMLQLGADTLAWICFPLFCAVVAGAVGAGLMQVGLVFSWKPVLPDASRTRIGPGLRRLMHPDRGFETAGAIARVVIVAAVGWFGLQVAFADFLAASRGTIDGAANALVSSFTELLAELVVLALLFGIGSASWRRFAYYRDLKMSRRELRREAREAEVNPEVKAARRRAARELLR